MSSLANVKRGIQVNMRGMNSITIHADGTSATLGGGVKSKEVIDYLWAREKQTGKCLE